MAIMMAIVPMAYPVWTTDRTLICRGLGGGAALAFGCAVLAPNVRVAIDIGRTLNRGARRSVIRLTFQFGFRCGPSAPFAQSFQPLSGWSDFRAGATFSAGAFC